mgnify:FL=1
MIIDFLSLNCFNVYLLSIILFIFCLNDKLLYYLLIIDLIINGIPFVTITITLLYLLNKNIFKFLNNNFINKYIFLIIYYFLFSIILYSIFNKFNLYIIKFLINNLPYNLIYYYIGLKILNKKAEYNE